MKLKILSQWKLSTRTSSINLKNCLLLYVDDYRREYIVKQFKRAEQGKDSNRDKEKRGIGVVEKLIGAVNPSKYIVQYHQICQTEKFYFLRMEKCDGSLEDLFRQKDINLDSQAKSELIIQLFYQIIQGYKYIKSLSLDFIHKDLCLENILYKKVNGKYIAKIAISRAILLNYDLFQQYHINRKFDYMPPETKNYGFPVQENDNIDVYTLGVCLYKMLFGFNSQVQHNEFKLVLPINEQNVSYCTFLNLLTQMLELNPMKRVGWEQLYQVLFQFPEILLQKDSDEIVTDYQQYLQRLELQSICQLLDIQMKEIAFEFCQLFRKINLPQEKFIIITIMQYTFKHHLQQLSHFSEDQFDKNIRKIRTGTYLVNLASKIQLDFIQRGEKFQAILLDDEEQLQILKNINLPRILEPFFKQYRRKSLKQSRSQEFEQSKQAGYQQIQYHKLKQKETKDTKINKNYLRDAENLDGLVVSMIFNYETNTFTIDDNSFYKLKKLPIVNQKDTVRLYVDDNLDESIVKQLKKLEQGSNPKKDKAQREIHVAEKLMAEINPSKYIVKYFQASETQQYYYLRMEKCDGSLEELFRQKEIMNMGSQERVELIIKLFYQIIRGYKYIKKLFPDFIHRDLCLDNIFYQKINGEYIAKIADYGVIKLNYGTLTFDFNKKIDYMPPEAKNDKGTGKYLDNLDVYTLGVCLYKMLFGLTSQVQYRDRELNIPNEPKKDSYCSLLDLINKMLEYEFMKRIGWQELYSLLYQFPKILTTKGRDDDHNTANFQLYLTERLQKHYLANLLDPQMKQIALSFKQLLGSINQPEEQFMTTIIMKYTFEQLMQQSTNITEEQFDGKIIDLRTARYVASLAGQIEQNFISKDYRYEYFDNKQQYQILKRIEKPQNLQPYFQSFIRNKLQIKSCIIF
ncbi:hypothetical protein pb186bvf_008304 [Paramecium bursaria]